jgi:hypothetical protein
MTPRKIWGAIRSPGGAYAPQISVWGFWGAIRFLKGACAPQILEWGAVA